MANRSLIVLALLSLAACPAKSPEAPPAAEQASEKPTEAAAAPGAEGKEEPAGSQAPDADASASAALLEKGVCAEEEEIGEVDRYELPDGARILIANCKWYAYQGSFQVWRESADGTLKPALRTDEGSARTEAGEAGFDPETGTLTWFAKARGPGDCGDYYVYVLEGETFRRKEHRRRPCDDTADEDAEIPPPSEWPLVEE